MKDVRAKGSEVQEPGEGTPGSILEEIAPEGARRLLIEAMETEVTEYIEKHQEKRNSEGRRLVVRNGYMPETDVEWMRSFIRPQILAIPQQMIWKTNK